MCSYFFRINFVPWLAFYVWNSFDRWMYPACWHIPWIHLKKKCPSVRSHLPVSSRDMNLKQLSYLGSQWKLSSSQMKDVPPSWVHRMKWLWCDVTLSTLACGNSSGNAAHSALPTAGKSVILDWECLGKRLDANKSNRIVVSIKSASKLYLQLGLFQCSPTLFQILSQTHDRIAAQNFNKEAAV